MGRVFPIKRPSTADTDGIRLVDVADERDSAALESLSSEMARAVVEVIREEPKPASEIATQLDSSIQNVRYHLDKLESAGVVRRVDIWYSASGSEMDVYAPTYDGLLVLTGTTEQSISTETLASSLLATFTSLAVASVIVAKATTNPLETYQGPIEIDPGMSAYLRPGLVFFAGGAFALVLIVIAIGFQRL